MNKFEEEIARINEECSEKTAPFNERIEQLQAKNKDLKQLRKIVLDEINVCVSTKAAIIEECRQKRQALYAEAKDYYSVNMSANKLRHLLRGFLAEHDEINEMWNAYVTANFGAAKESALAEVEGGAA